MNLDRLCACGCMTRLVPGMYVFEVGCLRYAQGCVKKVLVGREAADQPYVPAPRRPRHTEEPACPGT